MREANSVKPSLEFGDDRQLFCNKTNLVINVSELDVMTKLEDEWKVSKY